ncbi:MAG: hypothetical protein QF773_08420 [Lentisphaeria bacterium]|nr:hypothetical protein [Lentisphaeria bacterium]
MRFYRLNFVVLATTFFAFAVVGVYANPGDELMGVGSDASSRIVGLDSNYKEIFLFGPTDASSRHLSPGGELLVGDFDPDNPGEEIAWLGWDRSLRLYDVVRPDTDGVFRKWIQIAGPTDRTYHYLTAANGQFILVGNFFPNLPGDEILTVGTDASSRSFKINVGPQTMTQIGGATDPTRRDLVTDPNDILVVGDFDVTNPGDEIMRLGSDSSLEVYDIDDNAFGVWTELYSVPDSLRQDVYGALGQEILVGDFDSDNAGDEYMGVGVDSSSRIADGATGVFLHGPTDQTRRDVPWGGELQVGDYVASNPGDEIVWIGLDNSARIYDPVFLTEPGPVARKWQMIRGPYDNVLSHWVSGPTGGGTQFLLTGDFVFDCDALTMQVIDDICDAVIASPPTSVEGFDAVVQNVIANTAGTPECDAAIQAGLL